MKASAFSYARATSVMNALELLAAHGDGAKVLSGGQSLMPAMNLRLISPELLVDIGELAELRGIAVTGGTLEHRRADAPCRSSEFREIAPCAIADRSDRPCRASRDPQQGHDRRQPRALSLDPACDPASELPACMVALNATIIVRGPTGERRIAARDFFTGIYETALSADELLAAVELPVGAERTPRIFSTNSPGGMATTPSSASPRRRSSMATPSPSCASFSLRSAIGRCWPRPRTDWSTPRSTARCCRMHRRRSPRNSIHRKISRPPLRCAGIWPRCCWCVAFPRCSAAPISRHAAESELARGDGSARRRPAFCSEVNRRARTTAQVLPRLNLADFLREHLQLTGTHVGCEHGVCGACTVRVNGDIVRSCLMLAVQAHRCIRSDHRGIVR